MFLMFLLAMIPILWLVVALSILKMPGHKACVIAWILTAVLSIACWKFPVSGMVTAALEGVLNALWPICLVIIAALFTYNLILKTGAMEDIKKMLASVSIDKRVLLLLIGWGFGNFMEGMAGFGTAVAIPASMLAGIGVDPIGAVVGCLVVNSTPTAFGSVGVPTVTLVSVAGVETMALSTHVAMLQCILAFLSPFLLVVIGARSIKALKGMVPMILVAALSYLIPWYAAACFIGPELPDIIGSICSMVCIVLASRVLNREADPEYCIEVAADEKNHSFTIGEGFKAWCPFVLIFILLMATSNLCPPVHNAIAGIKTSVQVYNGENAGKLSFSWINTPGVIIFIAAVTGGLVQGATFGTMAEVLVETLKKYWKTIVTICSVMATAKIMSYSGMISDIANLLVAVAGSAYPCIAPLIGAVGAFVTGSGTSTCVLFGGLQSQTAASLGFDPSWMAAANVCGAGIGKMVCPQSIAIGAGAIGAVGSESKILGAVFKYFALFSVLAGIICYAGVLMGI